MAHRPVAHEPTVWQKCKMGAMMGGGVGLTIGFIFGSYSILRNGAGPRGFAATLSQYMLSSGATFAFFLAIGSVIRTDTAVPPHLTIQHPPTLKSRTEGSALIRARWQAELKSQKMRDQSR
ncbi:hypothetical protein BD410DRAFT_781436 [Rickenella mellea]|uniref:Mitochondrial genome maintenance protein Mgr2 n=1 Tax=Rickenella mellea TaxID=50990 RepID=A0A4Y7QPR3_9AGAM|nr:hypothetical protein BD410DRAFT_781436 [Rickenella mellea]